MALRPHLCSSRTRPRAPCGASYKRSWPCHTVRWGVSSARPAAFKLLAAAVLMGAGMTPAAMPTEAPAAACCGRTWMADSASSRMHRHAAAAAMAANGRRRRAGAPAAAAAGLRLLLGVRRGVASIMSGCHAVALRWAVGRKGNDGSVTAFGR